MESIEQTDKKVLQRNLINFIIHDVFNMISEEDILEIKSAKLWLYKGRELTEGEIKNLKQDAEILERLQLWKILKNELRYHAQQRLMLKSKTEEDLIAGKLLLFLVQEVENKVRSILK